MSAPVNAQLEAVITTVLDHIKAVKYGDVSVSFKMHDGRVVSVEHSITQTIRESKEERKMGP